MAAKRANRRGRAARQAEVGVIARVVDRAFDDPAMSGGLFVVGLTAMAIVSNAMFLQPSNHPTPLFGRSVPQPQDSLTTGATEVIVPLPRARTAAPPAPPTSIAEISVSPDPEPLPAPVVEVIDPARELAAAVQRELARLGLYSDAIDGIPGSRTRAAIERYESAAGLPVTGEVSRELLDMLTSPAAAEAVEPQAAAAPEVAAPAPLPRLDIAAIERDTEAALQAERFRRVQAALNKIGYGPINVDGFAGPDTVTAIQRFELDHGLDISGTAGEAVIARLVAIGALDAT